MHCLHILDPRLHKLYIAKSSIKYLVNIMHMKKADIWYHHSLRPAGNPGTPVCYHLLGEKPAFGWWFPQILRSLHIPVCCRRSWLGGLQEGHHPPELNHPVVSLLHISREHVSIDSCVLLVLYGPKLQSSDLHRVYIVFLRNTVMWEGLLSSCKNTNTLLLCPQTKERMKQVRRADWKVFERRDESLTSV